MNVFIVFQHSLGIGHLTRSSALASAFAEQGPVTLFAGGPPVGHRAPPPGVQFVQLPPTRFGSEVGAQPVPLDPAQDPHTIDVQRCRLLLDHQARLQPDVVIVEFYPFSPRRFGSTLTQWFRAIRNQRHKPMVVCSIRAYPRLTYIDADVDPQWINRHLREDFAGVLHHVDPSLIPLESLGPYVATALQGVPVVQTGFVRQRFEPLPPGERRGTLLTVGAGRTQDAQLIRRWIDAARLGPAALWPLTVVCGPLMGADDRALLRREASDDLTVHDALPTLDGVMQQVRGVVCRGGYNTLVEALSLGLPVLAFPNGPDEDQLFQIQALARKGLLLAGDASMPVAELAALMGRLPGFRPARPIDVDGARRSVQAVQAMLLRHRGR